jgi:hypothetical protein
MPFVVHASLDWSAKRDAAMIQVPTEPLRRPTIETDTVMLLGEGYRECRGVCLELALEANRRVIITDAGQQKFVAFEAKRGSPCQLRDEGRDSRILFSKPSRVISECLTSTPVAMPRSAIVFSYDTPQIVPGFTGNAIRAEQLTDGSREHLGSCLAGYVQSTLPLGYLSSRKVAVGSRCTDREVINVTLGLDLNWRLDWLPVAATEK